MRVVNLGRKRKTTEQFKQEVFGLVKDEYRVLGEYTTGKTKIELFHEKCGESYFVIPDSFLRGSGCPKCARKKTQKQFEKEVFDLVSYEYEVLGKYENNTAKIELLHKECGKSYFVTPSHFLMGSRCTSCSGYARKTTDSFEKEVFELVGNEYQVLGEYTNSGTKLKMRHMSCGEIYFVKPNCFLSGNRCPYCGGNMKKTTEEFKKQVFDLEKSEYKVLGDYENSFTKTKFIHEKCGKIYHATPASFLRGTRCPNCKESKGEKAIKEYLESKNIKHIREYTFSDCMHKRKLRFDFFVTLNSKETPFLLVEYNGEQHYKPIDAFGGARRFKAQQRKDEIKKKYCKENKIPLLIIPYTEFETIDKILETTLKVFTDK